ncbi:MAG: class I SAM-dependent methyltransferase [Deltaproteobacteria bacterium]|nr:class I SAM-dependent methyltransferase [Deltaproteobacteria bacterium]
MQNFGVELAERGLVPEFVLRAGIRRLLTKRLRDESRRHQDLDRARRAFVEGMKRAPIAPLPEKANDQHYEVPAALFEIVLGRQLKYSSGYWPAGVSDLDGAEEAMLSITAERAQLADGQRILELGCGWGSLTLWMARNYRSSLITAVSNSYSQRAFIEARAKREGLTNITVITADMNELTAPGTNFDRVVSVEMFEHMRNWSKLLHRVRGWIHDEARVFIHVFAHRLYAYPFEVEASDDWMGRNFFTGGMMPSADLFEHIDSPFAVENRTEIPGTHYAKTAEAWHRNLMQNEERVKELFERDLGRAEASLRFRRWKMFFLACAELFAFRGGAEWVVSHNLLSPRSQAPAPVSMSLGGGQ